MMKINFIKETWFKVTIGIIIGIFIVIVINSFFNSPDKSVTSENLNKKTVEIDLSTIINQWRPKVARIQCQWYSTNNQLIMDSFGSGIYYSNAILTNEHVLKYKNQAPSSCTVTFPDVNENYTVKYKGTGNFDEIGVLPNWDLGIIIVNNPSPYLKSISTIPNFCKTRAVIGEELVILGYPSIGSSLDITATEGIVSGYEGDYYITSAKVDHGNSGGLAILVKDNCYLGIPTYVVGGELESLARILDFSKYINSFNP